MKKWYEVGVHGGHGYGVLAESPEEALDQVYNAVYAHDFSKQEDGGFKLWEKKDLRVKEITENKVYHIIPAE